SFLDDVERRVLVVDDPERERIGAAPITFEDCAECFRVALAAALDQLAVCFVITERIVLAPERRFFARAIHGAAYWTLEMSAASAGLARGFLLGRRVAAAAAVQRRHRVGGVAGQAAIVGARRGFFNIGQCLGIIDLP